jgi:glucose-1-phosphate cytidylyltransferase
MKVVILAGGYGTRLSEYTKFIPKPMVKIKKIPIIVHIINHYKKYGLNDFIIASGYKSKFIQKFFFKNKYGVSIKVINTGLKTMTGGRIKRLEKIIGNETFLLTYGDGVSNVNIKKLVSFHKKNNLLCTLTAVRPPARFGAIKLIGKKVIYFKEKSKIDEGWINGGFFVFEPIIFKLIKNDNTFLEKEPLEALSKKKKLGAFKHFDFWQCMDTQRDKLILEKTIHKYIK